MTTDERNYLRTVTVDINSRGPVPKVVKSNQDTVITFLPENKNLYGIPKRNNSDKGSDFISKEYKGFWSEHNIIRDYSTPNLLTGTGFVERTIQSMKNLTKANKEDEQKVRVSLNKALYECRILPIRRQRKPLLNYISSGNPDQNCLT